MKKKYLIIISFVLVVLGVFLFSYDYLLEKKRQAFEIINFQLYGNQEPENKQKAVNFEEVETNNEVETDPEPAPEPKKEPMAPTYNYIGTLEIPKIGLKQGFVDMDSKDNDVNHNIQIIKPSSYPNIKNGNFILASHSGNSSISYFKHLYQLNKGDTIYVYYNNQKYEYSIEKIYTEPKQGYLNIYRDSTKTTLTLITCTKNDDTTQTIYVCYQKE